MSSYETRIGAARGYLVIFAADVDCAENLSDWDNVYVGFVQSRGAITYLEKHLSMLSPYSINRLMVERCTLAEAKDIRRQLTARIKGNWYHPDRLLRSILALGSKDRVDANGERVSADQSA